MHPAASLKLVAVPRLGWWRKLAAFSGPGYLIAVGYMDPGNWATDLAAGSHAGYALLGVVAGASLAAMVLQHLAIRLGVVTGRDLAQMCRGTLPRWVNVVLWLSAEVMIIACDLAEVIGTAIGLGLLFHLPLMVGLVVTGADVLMLLVLQNRGVRYLEALVVMLVVTVLGCFGMEVAFSHPALMPLLGGLVPTAQIFTHHDLLYLAIGIIGATVMPHNLYLHSSIVKTRATRPDEASRREAIRFATIDSTGALTLAMLVNMAIVIVAAAAFHWRGQTDVTDLAQAAGLLTPLLGAGLAGTLFAVALVAAGQNSTITATMAGQIIMEGFINLRLEPWLRRLITRSLAIVPAVVAVIYFGAHGLGQLLIASQVILSLQLPLAMIPLIWFTARRQHMGALANSGAVTVMAAAIGTVIVSLNVWLLVGLR